MVRLSGWVREQNAAGVVPVRITPRHRAASRKCGCRDYVSVHRGRL
jgi:hypothetical protein